MAYYLTGDYYKGDYYRGRRGDPGIFSAIGSVLKGASTMVGGFLKGGPVGAISAGVGLLSPKPASATAPSGLKLPGTGTTLVPSAILPGGVPFIQPSSGTGGSGYHLDKRTRSRYVKNRSMNPGNAKALRRAVRREHAFVALAKRALRGTGITIGRKSFGSRKRIGGKR